MAHFARINDDNIVQEVIVVSNTSLGDAEYPESEPLGQLFIASIGLSGVWKQTSYNGTFRGRYAGIGFTYDADLDEFVGPITETNDD